MRNITFTADEKLIEAAREQARLEQTTLNEQFAAGWRNTHGKIRIWKITMP